MLNRDFIKFAYEQRKAELEADDDELYGRGLERPEGDFCPICTLPIPLRMDEHSVIEICCMKSICKGCSLASQKRGMVDCAFCRTPIAKNDDEKLAFIRARVEKKDPEAIHFLATKYNHGHLGLRKNLRKAVKLFTEAAELGSVDALFSLGYAYKHGQGVEADEEKSAEFYKKAAMQGHVDSRCNLGMYEANRRNLDRAVRHWLISAKMGHWNSLTVIKDSFMRGYATKEEYAEALRGYQVAIEEMKSHDRDKAKRLGY